MLNSFVDLRCVHSTLAPNFANEKQGVAINRTALPSHSL